MDEDSLSFSLSLSPLLLQNNLALETISCSQDRKLLELSASFFFSALPHTQEVFGVRDSLLLREHPPSINKKPLQFCWFSFCQLLGIGFSRNYLKRRTKGCIVIKV